MATNAASLSPRVPASSSWSKAHSTALMVKVEEHSSAYIIEVGPPPRNDQLNLYAFGLHKRISAPRCNPRHCAVTVVSSLQGYPNKAELGYVTSKEEVRVVAHSTSPGPRDINVTSCTAVPCYVRPLHRRPCWFLGGHRQRIHLVEEGTPSQQRSLVTHTRILESRLRHIFPQAPGSHTLALLQWQCVAVALAATGGRLAPHSHSCLAVAA
jgi:hypothetical protein